MKIFNLIIVILICNGCSGIVEKYYRQIDKGQSEKRLGKKGVQHKFDFYRKFDDISKKQKRVKRKYVSRESLLSTPQYNEGSLWEERGQNNYLFSENHIKKLGDIVKVDIQGRLKKEISLELARSFPKKTLGKKKGDEEKESSEAPPAESQTAAGEEGDENNGEDETSDKVYDVIPTLIVEEIGKDYILLKGRKEVIYNKRKRYVELQALVARSSITEDESVKSNEGLETNVMVVK